MEGNSRIICFSILKERNGVVLFQIPYGLPWLWETGSVISCTVMTANCWALIAAQGAPQRVGCWSDVETTTQGPLVSLFWGKRRDSHRLLLGLCPRHTYFKGRLVMSIYTAPILSCEMYLFCLWENVGPESVDKWWQRPYIYPLESVRLLSKSCAFWETPRHSCIDAWLSSCMLLKAWAGSTVGWEEEGHRMLRPESWGSRSDETHSLLYYDLFELIN